MRFDTRAYVTSQSRIMRMLYPNSTRSTTLVDTFAVAMYHVGRAIQQERDEAFSICGECLADPWVSCECREWVPWDFAPRRLALDCEAPDMHRKVFTEMLDGLRHRESIWGLT